MQCHIQLPAKPYIVTYIVLNPFEFGKKNWLVIKAQNWLNTKFIKIFIYIFDKSFSVLFNFKFAYKTSYVLFTECLFGFPQSTVVLGEITDWCYQEFFDCVFTDVFRTFNGIHENVSGFSVTQVFHNLRCLKLNFTFWETGFWYVHTQSLGWPFTSWELCWVWKKENKFNKFDAAAFATKYFSKKRNQQFLKLDILLTR